MHSYIPIDPRSSAYTIIYFRDYRPPFHNLHLSAYLPRTPSWSHPTPLINPINFTHFPHDSTHYLSKLYFLLPASAFINLPY